MSQSALARSMRRVSEAFFPGSSGAKAKDDFQSTSRVIADLTLQQIIYYNCYFSLLWSVCTLALIVWKQQNAPQASYSFVSDPHPSYP
jgi:hypothetical protein